MQAEPSARPLQSTTTRPPRQSDNKGEYAYVSDAEFDRLSRAREFLWEVAPHGHRYATKQEDVDAALADGLYLPILLIEAVMKLHAYAQAHGREEAVRSLYIYMHDEAELRRRFKVRGDAPQDIERRIAQCRDWNARAEASGIPFYMLNGEQTPERMAAEALSFFRS